jgi:hypothetical protein
MEKMEWLKKGARGFVLVVRQIAVSGFFGLVLNICFTVALYGKLSGRVSGIETKAIYTGFLVLIPVAYLVLGKIYGVRLALFSVFMEGKDLFLSLHEGKMADYLEQNKGNRNVIAVLDRYFKGLETMPRPVRWITARLIDRLDLSNIAAPFMVKEGPEPPSSEEMARVLTERLGVEIDRKITKPELIWLIVLVMANSLLFISLYYGWIL